MGGVLKLDWKLGGWTLTSVTGYETLEMYSRADTDGKLDWLVGFYSLRRSGATSLRRRAASGSP